MFLLNPIISVLYNTKTNRWHPIVFEEYPLPGLPSLDNPVRHKSKGHHTIGFKTRKEAIDNINLEMKPKIEGALLLKDADIEWDGDDIPAMVLFFPEAQRR